MRRALSIDTTFRSTPHLYRVVLLLSTNFVFISRMNCFGECMDLGPPPDSILFLPPPPLPAFLQQSLPDLLLNTTPCLPAQLCESSPIVSNKIPETYGDYIELPRKDFESWTGSGINDTWLLVLVASSIGVLLLGALLAMFLLKCREMNLFGSSDCSMHSRQIKHSEPRDCASVTNINSNKLIHPSEAVLYHGLPNLTDNRMVWAALTPHGTQHFISENYPRDLIDYGEPEDHYETIDNMNIPVKPELPGAYHTFQKDYDYEDPAPLIETYQLNTMENDGYQIIDNSDMRCASLGGGTLRRGLPAPFRPRVSSPTRIEHPNLPPLNLNPHNSNTFKRNGTLSYKTIEHGTLPKYGGC